MRSAAFVALLALCGCSHSTEAAREARNDQQKAEAQSIIFPYYQCVRASAIKQKALTADYNMAVEASFQACATEEQRIRTYMALSGFSPAMSDVVMVRHKAALKQELTSK